MTAAESALYVLRMKQNQHIALRANLGGSSRVEMLEGREHLVVPVVALVEGVVNGAYVPAEEIAASLRAWNGVPFVVNHPSSRGVFISANSPQVLESQAIGRVFNAALDGSKFKAEVWIDTVKADALGGDAKTILERLRSNEALEVSTGYFADFDEAPGQFNGKSYSGIHRNLRPDHLAGLPNDTGACSWADGCGAPRVNSEEKGMLGRIASHLSGLAQAFGLKANIEISEADNPANSKQEDIGMEKAAKIQNLIACKCNSFGEADKAFLETLSDEQLDKIAVPPEVLAVVTNAEKPAPKPEIPAGMVLISNEDKAMLDQMRAEKAAQKTAVVERIISNQANKLAKEFLEAQTLETLQALEASIAPSADYSGGGGSIQTNADTDNTPPACILAEVKK